MFVMPDGQRWLVGRDPDANIHLQDVTASRRHAALSHDGAGAAVEDLGSTHGTLLNGQPIAAPRRLAPGDVVRVGQTRLVVVECPAAHAAEAPEPLPPTVDAVAEDPATVAAFRLALRLARSDISLILQGETGTGKEVLASVIHRHSARAAGPFVAINCAALTETLAESLLFGHERGSFTGATARHAGVFEQAHGGTLLLDEVGELSLGNQARLLRTLGERTIQRVGSTRRVPVDVRVLAATNRDLMGEVGWRRFRADLFFRHNGAAVTLPPLRERLRDVHALVARFLAEEAPGVGISRAALAALERHPWPGNIRELQNALQHAIAVCDGGAIEAGHLPPVVRGEAAPADTGAYPLRDRVADVERHTIETALRTTRGNQSHAARLLGITRRALIYRMELHGLKPRPGAAAD